MRALIFAVALLLVAAGANAADWTDNGDGTWSCAVTVTVTTDVKQKMEQCRKWDNYRFRYAEDELDASDWLAGLLPGFEVTQGGGTAYSWYTKLWRAFIRYWVPSSSTDPDADGLAIVVPSPPNQP